MKHLQTLLTVSFIFSATAAWSQENIFTPHHIAKLRTVTEAAVSPDGTQIAYVLSVPRNLPKEKDGNSWAELHVVDLNGDSTPFVTGPVNIGSIAWTPDSKQIAFLTKRDKDETRSLYVIGVRGGEARKLLSHSTDIDSFSFSGNGRQVAFLATEPTAKTQKSLQEQGFNQEIYEEDQKTVRVWIADGNRRTDEASKPAAPRMLKLEGSASELRWNPWKDTLAVALAPTPLIDDHLMFRKVHIVDVKTGAATNLNNPGKIGQFIWSQDGKHLALISGADKHDPMQGRLWVLDAPHPLPLSPEGRGVRGEGWHDISPSEHAHVESISWAKTLTCIGAHGVSSFFTEKYQGSGYATRDIPDGLILSNLTCSTAGTTWACIGHTAQHSPEVYCIVDNGEPRRLTDSNPWLRTMRFAKQEVVKYKARDGLELEGVLVRPLDEKKGKRYPLVLTVHGGPESHYSNGWVTLYHSLGQVAAAKGMAVFYPNYRGSTGYGVKFSMLGQREAAGKEFDDLVDGVDHLIKIGLVDGKKVGITGGSYGGYATAWGATYYSDRFAAGVMFVGVSDWISCSGTTDIPYEMNLVHHRQWLWDDWDYFMQSSPLRHVEKSKTPLLILHGKNDPRVHPSQSLELYRHLKVRGQAPVRLVLYPGEGHGNRRAASRLDYNLRLLQWMAHYLQGPGGAMPDRDIDYGAAAPKTSSASWNRPRPSEAETTAAYWLGYGCPCCIGS